MKKILLTTLYQFWFFFAKTWFGNVIKKVLKALGLYNAMCRTFLPKRKFIVEPFVYISPRDEIARGEITNKIRWLEKFEIETQCIEFSEYEFWKEARKKYGFYDAIWLF